MSDATTRGPRLTAPMVLLVLLTACDGQTTPERAIGQLESDRVELNADAAEPVVQILVREGDTVQAGQILMRLDTRRTQSRVNEADAIIAELEARLAELTRGPRTEQIQAARANVQGAQRDLTYRRLAHRRAQDLLQKKLGPPEDVDRTRAALDAADAQREFYRARLFELLEGTTIEELTQAQQRVIQVRARRDGLSIDLQSLTVRAPANGIVDSILLEPGERPAVGQTLLVLLTGTQAYARVYVPEPIRVKVTAGSEARLLVDGVERPLAGRVRRISNDPVFTPYLALTEHDRGRLSYVAEIEIVDTIARLPDGVPVEAQFTLSSRKSPERAGR